MGFVVSTDLIYINILSIVFNTLAITDIILFAISEFIDAFFKLMNQEDVTFKSQFMMEYLSSIDKVFIF